MIPISRKRNFGDTKTSSNSTQASSSKVITLTFGDMAENHRGMEKIGEMVNENEGFNILDLKHVKLENSSIINLSIEDKYPQASILLIKNGVEQIIGHNQIDLFTEQLNLNYDKKAYMYGKVVDKKARWNLCFDNNSRDPDYGSGKGRIISFDDVPLMKSMMEQLPFHFGDKAKNLKVESNYYYDINKCGIGYHGDSERRKVIGIRLGNCSLPLYFQWYLNSEAVSAPIKVNLDPGDIYIMSEKACGTDWKKKKIYTLRHATGCNNFVKNK